MNALVGEKLSIITSKAQTTRHRIMGIVNGDDFQIVYSDTPGILKPAYKLQESMMNFVRSAVSDADVVLYVTDTVEEQGERSADIIENDIAAIISENDDRARHTGLSEIGNRLVKKYSDFDVRTYGYSTLSKFVAEMDRFSTDTDEKGAIIVRLRNSDSRLASIENHIRKTVADAGKSGIELGRLGQGIYHAFDGFKTKDFGYNTFAKFIRSIEGIEIIRGKDNSQTVRVKE